MHSFALPPGGFEQILVPILLQLRLFEGDSIQVLPDCLQSHAQHDADRHDYADSEEEDVGPADIEAHLLVAADEAATIEGHHEVSERHQHEI